VFLNTPYTMTTSNPGQFCNFMGCDCAARGLSGYVGYVSLVTHGVADILGSTLAPIHLNETLEKQQWFPPSYAGAGNPAATPWYPSDWNSNNTFNDYLSICAPSGTSVTPRPASSGSGTTILFNETQKFWIGSTTHFVSVCVQRGVLTLYTDHGAVSPYYSPILNKADCNAGNVLN
jgi:hypothetical protein